ncbi:uncharacterized protein LOC123545714 [Mercenaria mercenaria]|uniref:uncharacterized protein LOC123545714 n=1 Tax=Mercenaria mercenaria TaxID=6596 RepID=UPI00234FA09A|nr:uncharacterized protein LOC123545714 [Mercenaria mercenaria]
MHETSVTDSHFLDGRLEAFPYIGSLNRCTTECYSELKCVSAAFSSATYSCQLYKYDVANFTVNAVHQAQTDFYKVVCDQHDYTYIRSLNICMKMYGKAETFNVSRSTCDNDGAHLLHLDTPEMMDYLKAILAHIFFGEYQYYLGGYGLENSTEYRWFDVGHGTDIPITEGNGGEFWGQNGTDHCVSTGGCCLSLQSDGQNTQLASVDCTDELMFICTIDM